MQKKSKKLKQEAGISLLSLGIAIIVMIIIAATLVYNTSNHLNIKKLEDMYHDIEQLQDSLAIYEAKTGGLPLLQPYTNIEMILTNTGVRNPNDGDEYYVIDINAIENLSLYYGKDFDNIKGVTGQDNNYTDVYIVNKKSHTVYYPKGITIDKITYYRDKEEYQKVEIAQWSAISVKETPYTDKNGQTITIPIGLGYSLIEGMNTIADGLVVCDKNGNEFVWVPIENAVAQNETQIAEMVAQGKYPMAVKTSGIDANGRQNYRGILYDFGYDSTNKKVTVTPKTYTDAGNREPAYLTDATYADESSYNQKSDGTKIVTQESMQTEYNEMVEKVLFNKGFFIARYETSIKEGIVQSKPMEIPANASRLLNTSDTRGMMWYGMYSKQKELTTSSKTSHMIWGSQYDQVMIWMKEISNDGKEQPFYVLNSIDMGNYSSNIRETGLNGLAQLSVKNIYDLAGNVYEWTMEASGSASRVLRGGSAYSVVANRQASNRNAYHAYGIFSENGTRMTLY